MTPRFIVCRASAGSGKTHTLVRKFIEIAISSPAHLEERFEHILAITFTNKAANGMKERIMKQLDQIVRMEETDGNLVNGMAADLGVDDGEVRRRCAVLQAAILHHYSKLSVCTIDSFVHRIVRTFAHDLHLPQGFDVMIDPKEVLQAAVDQMLSLAGQEDEQSLTRILCTFAESKMEAGTSYNVETQIADLAGEILKEETPAYLAKLEPLSFEQFLEIYRRLRADMARSEQHMQSEASRFVDACATQGLQVEDFPGKSNGALSYMQRVAEGRLDLVAKPYAKVLAAHDDGVFAAKQSDQLAQLMPLFREVFGAMMDLNRDYNTQKLLVANLFSMALLGKLSQLKNDYYKENEVVHISEFNKRIAQEVVDQPTPFIYERIGSRYHNYLIDEFQDTSKLQWMNFLPLLDEAMSHRFDPQDPDVGAQSLVVGDGKQAIYRFRQGDVRQFMQLPKVDAGSLHGQSLRQNAKIDPLSDNWRTKANVVEFNNRFFKQLMDTNGAYADNPVLRELYIGSAQAGADTQQKEPDLWQHPKKKGGFVQVGFYDEEQMLPAILAAIRHQTDDLGYDYGDIMVLARNNSTLASIAAYLTENSRERPIPIVSSESFVLSGSRVVLLLQVLLRYLYDERDRVAAAQIVQLLSQLSVVSVPERQIMAELRQSGWNLRQVLVTYNIDYNAGRLRSLSLYDCCEELVRAFHLGARDASYVATFFGVVAAFAQRPHADLGALNRYLDENLDRLSSSTAGGGHAVRLLTIHKAKGLEEKIVIFALPYHSTMGTQHWVEVPEGVGEGLPVAFVHSQKGKATHFDAVFKEEEVMSQMDRINLLYVALTRAEDKLIVVCQDKVSKEGRDEIALLRAFVENDSGCRPADEQVYETGDDAAKQVAPATKKEEVQPMVVDEIAFPRWEERISIADQHADVLSTIEDDSRRYGILIHSLMAHIITSADVERVVNDYCTQHRLDATLAERITERIQSMIAQHPQLFQPGLRVLCEQSLSVDCQQRRPDRIVFAPDAVWVVDYKTGSDDAKLHEKYEQQVAEYAHALEGMGYSPVRTSIIYM